MGNYNYRTNRDFTDAKLWVSKMDWPFRGSPSLGLEESDSSRYESKLIINMVIGDRGCILGKGRAVK
jgi:hypothetical protein